MSSLQASPTHPIPIKFIDYSIYSISNEPIGGPLSRLSIEFIIIQFIQFQSKQQDFHVCRPLPDRPNPPHSLRPVRAVPVSRPRDPPSVPCPRRYPIPFCLSFAKVVSSQCGERCVPRESWNCESKTEMGMKWLAGQPSGTNSRNRGIKHL